MTRARFAATALWLVALAAVLTFLLAWLIFPWEIAELNLELASGLSAERIKANFDQLMAYLLLPWVNPLEMADFPVSASGAKHFVDVKRLFLLAEAVCLVLAYPALRFFQKEALTLYRKPLLVMASLPFLVAGLGLLVGFETFFTLFHTVLFPGDSSWLFNPATDPVILILPAEFFLHCFLIFFVLYEGLFLGLWALARRSK